MRNIQYGILAVLAQLTLPPTLSAQAGPPDRATVGEVLAVTQRLFDAMKLKDTASMRRVFHPTAKLVGMRPTPGGPPRVQVLTADEFIAFVGRDARPDWTERAWDPEVRIEGTLATVWAAYDFHFGSTFSHCGVDALHLLKTDEGWRIMAIADTYQTVGCPRRPAPGGLTR
jgi:hypothetical protein